MADSNNFIVLTFVGFDTASTVYKEIEQMEKDGLVEVEDAIILERAEGEDGLVAPPTSASFGDGGAVVPAGVADENRIRVVQTHAPKGKYTRRGAGIGLLAGILIGGPIAGIAIGAGLGRITASLRDFGISDKSIEAIKQRLQPNSSALLVLGKANDRDALLAKLRAYDPTLISSTLSSEKEKELREQLAGQ
ncbi:MAG: DUF1269 domain-containing protein [Ardenticatenaceae bacterium]|nr:DUF1269 domain-containing protein [Ardenticatenaceae bacterium]MCB8987581.1 DUF1269 domain-containing protein [Ardenticatenaceae bacterium]